MFSSNDYFSVILVFVMPSSILNFSFLYIILTRQHLQTVPNLYLISLLIANIISAISVSVQMSVYIFSPETENVYFFCSIMEFIDKCLHVATSGCLACMANERFKYFVKTTTYIPSHSDTKKSLILIWFISVLYCILSFLLIYMVGRTSLSVDTSSSCDHQLNVGDIIIFTLDLIGIQITTVVFFVIQYARIIKKLWCNPYSNIILHYKRKKSVYMLLGISIATWCLMAIVDIAKKVNMFSIVTKVEFVILLIQTLSLFVLPVVYIIFSEQTKREYRSMLKLCTSNRVENAPICDPNTFFDPNEQYFSEM